MIKKEKIIEVIEHLCNHYRSECKHSEANAMLELLSIIDGLQEEPRYVWREFIPSIDLPKERVSIAYETHDDRGLRFAYGYFQFYNGTCTHFWKDGNEQPKSIKADDIRYWMPIPYFTVVQYDEETSGTVCPECKNLRVPVSNDIEKELRRYVNTREYIDSVGKSGLSLIAHHFVLWQKKMTMKQAMEGHIVNDNGDFQLICPALPMVTRTMDEGEKCKVVIIKDE